MRILLDESLPRKLALELLGHDVQTVQKRGWAGLKNGALLREAGQEFRGLLTGDQNLEFQQNRPKAGTANMVSIVLEKDKSIKAFAVIVDINAFTRMVSHPSSFQHIAQFTRDILAGAIHTIEREGGQVIGFMGDAILGLIEKPQATYRACVGIARDLNEQCRYVSAAQREEPPSWEFCPGGPSLKIGIEFGWLNGSTITGNFLGEQLLYIGGAINYAARITSAGVGNRCHIGLNAYEAGLKEYPTRGPFSIAGKTGEGRYEFYRLDFSDVWLEGKRRPGRRTYIDD